MPPSSEVWKDIPGYRGFYQVSDLGKVRSLDREAVDKIGRKQKIKGKNLSCFICPTTGYPTVGLFRNGIANIKSVHVLVLLAFVGPRPNGFQACHNDGNAANSALTNLRWASVKENSADKLRHGTHIQGIKHALAKLTELDVQDILRSIHSGVQQKSLARAYRVSTSVISEIKNGKAWKHVKQVRESKHAV